MTPSHLSHPKYRSDIDGLRAVAVLSVVSFHASKRWLPGGFIGVDIFFVISGYLISTIIFENLQTNTFSFTSFYARRIKRIFPALIVVLLYVLVFGWFALLSDEYMQLGKHMAAGAGFVSNFALWGEAGYFDNLSETKPLLHLWSLGVEEQFYLIWPLIVWLAWITSKRSYALLTLVLAIALASLLLNLITIGTNPVATFYSPQTRFWELLTGSLLALFVVFRPNKTFTLLRPNLLPPALSTPSRDRSPGGRAANTISLFGAALIVFGLLYIRSTFSFPGVWAVPPVLGAALLILAGPQAWLNKVVLSNRIAIWFGVISFPLYLWHWPLLSLARIIESANPSAGIRYGAVALAICLSWLTYRLIERPIRFGPGSAMKVGLLVGCMAVLGCTGYLTYRMNGFPFRAHAILTDYSGDIGNYPFKKYMSDTSDVCTPDNLASEALTSEGFVRCRQSKRNRETDIALIGDSHAEHLFIGLAAALPQKNLVYYIKNSPAFLYNKEFSAIFSEVVGNKNIKIVIYTMLWTGRIAQLPADVDFEQEVAKTVDALIAAGKIVYLVDDVPGFPFPPERCQGRRWLAPNPTICEVDAEAERKYYQRYVETLKRVVSTRPDSKLLSIHKYFCGADTCRMTKGHDLLYRDDNHLNIVGSRFVGAALVAANPGLFD